MLSLPVELKDNPFLGSDEEVDDRIDKLMKGEGGEKFKINYIKSQSVIDALRFFVLEH